MHSSATFEQLEALAKAKAKAARDAEKKAAKKKAEAKKKAAKAAAKAAAEAAKAAAKDMTGTSVHACMHTHPLSFAQINLCQAKKDMMALACLHVHRVFEHREGRGGSNL